MSKKKYAVVVGIEGIEDLNRVYVEETEFPYDAETIALLKYDQFCNEFFDEAKHLVDPKIKFTKQLKRSVL